MDFRPYALEDLPGVLRLCAQEGTSLPHIAMSGFRLYPEYSGPDRERTEIVWRAGRRVSGRTGS